MVFRYENQYGMLQQQSFNMEQQNFAVQSLKDTHATVAAMKDSAKVMQQEFKKINLDEVEVSFLSSFPPPPLPLHLLEILLLLCFPRNW